VKRPKKGCQVGRIRFEISTGANPINDITALLFMAGRKRRPNIKGAFLQMASDALLLAGTVAAGALILADRRSKATRQTLLSSILFAN
jgi:Co/Zn/Cd efflux system component